MLGKVLQPVSLISTEQLKLRCALLTEEVSSRSVVDCEAASTWAADQSSDDPNLGCGSDDPNLGCGSDDPNLGCGSDDLNLGCGSDDPNLGCGSDV